MKANQLKEEKGIALVIAMMLLLVVTLIGVSAVTTTTYDNLISGNKRASEQAFYVAEAGVNEFLGRLRSDASTEIKITDNTAVGTTETLATRWKILLAKSSGSGATSIGYGSTTANTTNIASIQSQLDFGIEIVHKLDTTNKVVGDPAVDKYPIYIVKSYGFSTNSANRAIEIEIEKTNLDAPAALYAENPANIQGTSTNVIGLDGNNKRVDAGGNLVAAPAGNPMCGGTDKYGIVTTLPSTDENAIDTTGNPKITGSSSPTGTPPSIQYSGKNLSLQDIVDDLKGSANYSTNSTNNLNLQPNDIEVGGVNPWGTPSYPGGTAVADQTTTPLTYSGDPKIVYFNMKETDGTLKTLTLTGGVTGAGVLLVDGNLNISGAFEWYGVIIVTGALDFTGGGQKNVTGGILAGESATIEIDVAGNAGIIYCSKVGDWLNNKFSHGRITRWRDVF